MERKAADAQPLLTLSLQDEMNSQRVEDSELSKAKHSWWGQDSHFLQVLGPSTAWKGKRIHIGHARLEPRAPEQTHRSQLGQLGEKNIPK